MQFDRWRAILARSNHWRKCAPQPRTRTIIIKNLEAEHQSFDEDLRTPPLFSVPGSIAASFGLGVDDLPTLYRGRLEGHGYMVTKWRTPVTMLNDLQHAVNGATNVAKNWRMDDVPDDEQGWPGCYISARAVIHAAARNYDFAGEVYEDMKAIRPDGWEADDDGRLFVMERFQMAMPIKRVIMFDQATIEGALCQMMGLQPKHIFKTGLVDKRRTRDLVNGRSIWRQDEIDDVLFPALYEVSCNLQKAIPYAMELEPANLDAIAKLSPAMTATAWQVWPVIRNEIAEVSPWFSVYHPE